MGTQRTVVLLVCFAPLIVLLLPVILSGLVIVLVANMVRASEYQPSKFLGLVRLLISEIKFLLSAGLIYGPPTCRYLLNSEYKSTVKQSARLDSPSPTTDTPSRDGTPIPFNTSAAIPSFPKMKKGIPFELLVSSSVETPSARVLLKAHKLDVYPCCIGGTTPPVATPRSSANNGSFDDISARRGGGRPTNSSFGGSRTPLMRSLSSASLRRPVILFIYGGGFSSGGRWQYWKFANQLREQTNAMVVVPDYPTYPNGCILEMAESVARALVWTYENCERFGGSKNHIWVVGHSAGAHLASYVVLRSMMAKASQSNELPVTLLASKPAETPINPLAIRRVQYKGCGAHGPKRSDEKSRADPLRGSVDPSRPAVDFRRLPVPRGLVLFSGVYDLYAHRWFENVRGVHLLSAVSAATGGLYDSVSPLQLANAMIEDPATFPLQRSMCPPKGFRLVHSQADHVVSVEQSLAMRRALEALELTANSSRTRSTSHFSGRAHQVHLQNDSFDTPRCGANNGDDSPLSALQTFKREVPTDGDGSAEPTPPLGPAPIYPLCPNGVQEFLVGGHATVVTGPMEHPQTSVSHHETVVHIVNAIYGS